MLIDIKFACSMLRTYSSRGMGGGVILPSSTSTSYMQDPGPCQASLQTSACSYPSVLAGVAGSAMAREPIRHAEQNDSCRQRHSITVPSDSWVGEVSMMLVTAPMSNQAPFQKSTSCCCGDYEVDSQGNQADLYIVDRCQFQIWLDH